MPEPTDKPRDEPRLATRIAMSLMALPANEVDARLHDACAGDESLMNAVRAMLQVSSAAGTSESIHSSEAVAKTIRPFPNGLLELYEPIRALSAGKQGVVWLVRDKKLDRLVAIKLIIRTKPSIERIARMVNEGSRLAKFTHPNIATLFNVSEVDTGDSRQPYLVMEYVGEREAGGSHRDGQNILEFAKKEALTADERLWLLELVCDAIVYAHVREIPHGDLHAGNVLVYRGSQGIVVKLIDFGLAVLTAEHRDAIGKTGDVQVGRSEPPATDASSNSSATKFPEVDPTKVDDVRRFGKLLELLFTPMESLSTRASGLTRMQRTELAAIVARCGTPASDIYHSQEVLADIRRCRRHVEPVAAVLRNQRPFRKRMYRARKWLRRHRVAVALCSVLSLGICVSTVFGLRASRSAREADKQRDTALEQTAVAQETVAFLQQDVFEPLDPSRMADPVLRDAVVTQLFDPAFGRVDSRLATTRPTLAASVFDAFCGLYQGVGKPDQALLAARRSYRLRSDALGPKALLTLASLQNLGTSLIDSGLYEEAVDVNSDLVRSREAADGATSVLTLRARVALADALRQLKRFPESESELRTVLRVLDDDSIGDATVRELVNNDMSATLTESGKPAEALPFIETVCKDRSRRLGDEALPTLEARVNQAAILGRLGRNEEAGSNLDVIIPLLDRVFGRSHPAVINAVSQRAQVKEAVGDIQGSIDAEKDCLARSEARLGRTHPDTLRHLFGITTLLDRQHRLDEMATALLDLIDRKRSVAATPDDAELVTWTIRYGRVLNALRRFDEAVAVDEALLKTLLDCRNEYDIDTITAMADLIAYLNADGRTDDAFVMGERALRCAESSPSVGRSHPYFKTIAIGLAELYFSHGRVADADEVARRCGIEKQTPSTTLPSTMP